MEAFMEFVSIKNGGDPVTKESLRKVFNQQLAKAQEAIEQINGIAAFGERGNNTFNFDNPENLGNLLRLARCIKSKSEESIQILEDLFETVNDLNNY